ncbi:hypothetical protein I8920_12980 [Curtobacterium sp. YC1]|uniref:hypothetical protein n=1 Tax=Curtobacterium sp. YC1 TaxID=2795488 RepID=UPI0018E54965|nr:hypothetical protein [Curtobacterium sp. YC1]QQD75718.1 hypothetical protein I8920_12980 [Curtobacterium sp. YC1]
MIDPDLPGAPVFRAPDGRLYVDRQAPAVDTLTRWRRLYDPIAVRRRARIVGTLPLLAMVVGYVVGGALGVVVAPLLMPGDDRAVAQLTGVVVGGGVLAVPALFVVAGRDLRPDRRVVVVPDEVVERAPQGASAAAIWRWSTAIADEAAERPTIGYETYVERPPDLARAARATERYSRVYRDYRAAAAELGLPAREPAIELPAEEAQ